MSPFLDSLRNETKNPKRGPQFTLQQNDTELGVRVVGLNVAMALIPWACRVPSLDICSAYINEAIAKSALPSTSTLTTSMRCFSLNRDVLETLVQNYFKHLISMNVDYTLK